MPEKLFDPSTAVSDVTLELRTQAEVSLEQAKTLLLVQAAANGVKLKEATLRSDDALDSWARVGKPGFQFAVARFIGAKSNARHAMGLNIEGVRTERRLNTSINDQETSVLEIVESVLDVLDGILDFDKTSNEIEAALNVAPGSGKTPLWQRDLQAAITNVSNLAVLSDAKMSCAVERMMAELGFKPVFKKACVPTPSDVHPATGAVAAIEAIGVGF